MIMLMVTRMAMIGLLHMMLTFLVLAIRIVMVMVMLMVTTVAMARLVQPVYMDSLTNRSQAQPVLCNNSAL